MAISEIGVSFPDDTFGKESRFGIPFTVRETLLTTTNIIATLIHCCLHSIIQYILRDILQFDKTLIDATSRLSNAHRTCDLILGVGDGKVGALLLV